MTALLCMNTLVWAQSSVEKEADRVLNVQPSFMTSTLALRFKNQSISEENLIEYESNASGRFGTSLGYRNLGLTVATSLPPVDTEYRGSSSLQDYSLRFLGRHTWDFSYQKNIGFYQRNYADPVTLVHPQRAKLSMERLSALWMYNFYHEDLSLPATFNYSGWQRSSGWTPLAFVNLNRTVVSDNVSIVPTTQKSSFPNLTTYKKIDRNSLALGLGIAGSFVYKNFQASLLTTIGGSLEQKTFYDTTDGTSSDTSGSAPANLFFNLGYNGEYHQFGLSVFAGSFDTKSGTEIISQYNQDARFFYGYRFDEVNLGSFVNTISDWLD